MNLANVCLCSALAALLVSSAAAQAPSGDTSAESQTNWKPLPARDPGLSSDLEKIVREIGLDAMTPASDNPDEEDEWSSISIVDLSDPANPRMGGWKEDNFIYPASAYKVYVLGEAIRQVTVGEIALGDTIQVKPHNVRGGSKLEANRETTVSEVLRLMQQFSDNTAANEAIDLTDRERVTELLHSLGCQGSEVTRKFLSRDLEDPGYAEAPSTTTNALHMATFLWAVESGAIGGGRGRGLIKSYMGMTETGADRFRKGLPKTATLYSKTGTWNIFTSEVAIVEDGDVRFILCALVPFRSEQAEPMLARLAADVYAYFEEDRE